MKTTGIFTTHNYKYELAGKSKPVKLIVFGDVHKGSPNHAKGKWREFLQYAKKQSNAIFLGMGDYIDSTSTSERDALAMAKFHESTVEDLEQLANMRVNELGRELEFMKGRLIGLIGGNHYFQFRSGMNSDMKLSEKLDCKFLGVCALIRLSLQIGDTTTRGAVDIFAHHGAGGARLFGGSINRVDQLREFVDADIFCMGHDHKRGAVPANPKIALSKSMRIVEKQQWLGRTGSFLAAYQNGISNYNVDSARGPCSLGWIEFDISMSRLVPCVGEKTPPQAIISIKGIS